MKPFITYEKAINRAMYLCSRGEKCKSDIRKKLYDWKADPKEHEKIIKELEKQRYIDEERYTRYYVRDKFTFNKWGKIKIRSMLFQKQIPEQLIDDAICQINDEDYLEMLKKVINQKLKSIKETDANKRKSKLLQFASSRGFEAKLIFKILGN